MTRQADIIIPVYRDVAVTVQCIESVFAHTGAELGQVIVVNDRSPDPEMAPALERLYQKHADIVLVSNETNLGFIGSVNLALELRRNDVVLLNSDTRVTPGWLTELIEVAYLHDRIACVSPLSNNATICSVPEFWGRTRPEQVDSAQLRLKGLPRYTIAPTGVGFCLLLKRLLLNMIGPLDSIYGRGYNEENDWVQRARSMGFLAARANHAFVYHLGEVSFGGERSDLNIQNGRMLSRRYPHFEPDVQRFCEGVEGRVASHAAVRQTSELSACIDLRHVPANKNGTAVYGVELVKALKRHTKVEVSAVVANKGLEELLASEGIRCIDPAATETLQVLHRPAQAFEQHDLVQLLAPSAHAILTYQDLIGFRTPSAFKSYEQYEKYRALSFASVQAAQAVIAISEHNRSEIISELGVPPERVHRVYHGVDAVAFGQRDEAVNRRRLERFGIRRRFFLNAGGDRSHKNVRLLLTAYARFRENHAGAADLPDLVLFGPATRTAGGLYHLAQDIWVQPGVHYLGLIDDRDVRSLFQEATAFLYPTAYEGFGLPVLEAMAAGTPVICSNLTSLPEVAGDACLYIKDFTPDEIAALMTQVLESPDLRTRLVEAGRERVKEFTWERTARRTAEVYEQVVQSPSQQSLFNRQMFSVLLRG